MQIANGAKPRPVAGSKSWAKRAPNPTNFSNLRSHMYLTETGSASGARPTSVPAVGISTPHDAHSAAPNRGEEAKSVRHLPPALDQSTPASTHRTGPNIFPQTTKLRQPVGLDDENTSSWKAEGCWTERQPPKVEFCPIHIQKMEKLQQKQLPANNESLIDSSIVVPSGIVPKTKAEKDSRKPPRKEVKVGIRLYDAPGPKKGKDKDKTKKPTVTKPEEKKKAKRSRSEQRKKQQATEKETVYYAWGTKL